MLVIKGSGARVRGWLAVASVCFLSMAGFCGRASAAPTIYYLGTSGAYDEQTGNANSVDIEVVPGSLAPFTSRLVAAFANNTGGVIDFTNLGQSNGAFLGGSTAGKSGTESGELVGTVAVPMRVVKNQDINNVLLEMTMPSELKGTAAPTAPMVYTRQYNDSSTGLPAISGFATATNKYFADTLMTSQRFAVAGDIGKIWFDFMSPVAEVGITALPAQWLSVSGRTADPYTQEVKATFSGGGSQTLTATMNKGVIAQNDTFFHIAAPAGQSISRLELTDPLAGGMIAFDDLGFITGVTAVPEPSAWALFAAGSVAAAAVASRLRR